ncbi:MAG: hypothetical protein Q8M65_05915, partial [Rhodoglobus sp.]|nr:hypothetical protein [Rhodoglobus sp.]
MAESTEARFVADVIAAARDAEARHGATVQHLDVAGVRIDLHYAGTSLRDLLGPALAHLEVEPDTAEMSSSTEPAPVVVRLWDTGSTGVSPPAPPVSRDRFTDRGDLIGMNDPAYRVAFHWSEYSVCVLDVASGEAAYWVADTA